MSARTGFVGVRPGNAFGCGSRHMTAAVLQQAVDADLRPPMMRVLAGSSGAQNASRHVHRPDDDVHQLERPALVESVRVALRAFRPIHADRPVGQFDAVDCDRFADARRGAEFARHAPNGRRRNRRDRLDVFRRVSLDVLAQQLECRPALSPVRLIGSGDRRIAQARIIVNFDRVVGQVVEQGLPCRRIAQITPVRADQVGSIGLMLRGTSRRKCAASLSSTCSMARANAASVPGRIGSHSLALLAA